jgi:intracellular sulfur oxidation DsrE/DsrF family protein
MKKELVELLEKLELLDFVNVNETYNDSEELFNEIMENRGFIVEIIYYKSAIKFLAENDTSLKESLAIAEMQGYEIKNINSEILASLLASEMKIDEFNDNRAEIDNILKS